mmetsp:Transcript_30515/g.37255  ORF Transcript_30515/g.37255 Transcript_30515/m.37255 type:complete len:945 (+) Transcript_30515:2-2836(+)
MLFVGSQFGDSQLVMLEEAEQGNIVVRVLEEYTNLGPIMDFDIVPTGQMSRSGVVSGNVGTNPCQIVTCSGGSKDGSLRLVRNGIGIEEQASVEFGGIKGLWSLRSRFFDEHDSYLVQSYFNETRILGFGMDDDDEDGGSMEEVILAGFDAGCSTLFAANVFHSDGMVQITSKEIRLVAAESLEIQDIWKSEERAITVASGNESGQIVLALRGGVLVYLEIVDHRIKEINRAQMEREVSCLNLNPLSTTPAAAMDIDQAPPSPSTLLAVGLWDDFTVRLLSLDGTTPLTQLLKIELTSDTQARSLILCSLGPSPSSHHMLLIGLGDGNLISYCLNLHPLQIHSKKKVSLGTQSLSLSLFRNTAQSINAKKEDTTCVFATGDRPTVIYAAGSSTRQTVKIGYANVNLSAAATPTQQMIVNNITSFKTKEMSCLCLSDESTLRIGIIDDIQKLHVQTFPLGGLMPRRIAHHAPGRCFVVGCVNADDQKGTMSNVIKCFDDNTFEEIDHVDLDPFEMVLSLASVVLKNKDTGSTDAADNQEKSFVIVGTAYAYPDEDEPTKGRILVFECNALASQDDIMETSDSHIDNDDANNNAMGMSVLSRSLRHVTEVITRGGVHSICPFVESSLLVSVNSKTTLYRYSFADGMHELQPETGASHHGHILTLLLKSHTTGNNADCDNIAIVGDLMRSISVLEYDKINNTIEEVARDYNANWVTAVEMLASDVYLGAENWNNLFILKRNTNPNASDELKCRLETQAEFHLGEMVNKFMKGSLVMSSSSPSTPATATTTQSFVNGETLPPPNTTASSIVSHPIQIGSQTLYATVDGSIGVILGLSQSTFAFFNTLERAMAKEIPGLGELSHDEFRAFEAERKLHPRRGFVDGDLVESFLDLRREQMEIVVKFMNEDGGWEVEDDEEGDRGELTDADPASLTVEEVVTRVEEMSRLH